MNPVVGRGSTTVELVLLTPVLVLLTTLVVGVGRDVEASATAQLAAEYAARAASMVRRSAMASTARSAALEAVGERPTTCDRPRVEVTVSSDAVTVEVVCHADGRTIRGVSVEVLDRYRSDL